MNICKWFVVVGVNKVIYHRRNLYHPGKALNAQFVFCLSIFAVLSCKYCCGRMCVWATY
jgi:hypothetical protein